MRRITQAFAPSAVAERECGHRREDTDHSHHDHQFDQGKTVRDGARHALEVAHRYHAALLGVPVPEILIDPLAAQRTVRAERVEIIFAVLAGC